MDTEQKVRGEVMKRVDTGHLVDRLEGRAGGLRPSKPTASGDDGLTQFVWRMAQFDAGYNTSMPVTATWWLQDWLDEQDISASVKGVMDDEGKAVLEELDEVTTEVLIRLGEDPTTGARRWKNAGLF